MQIIQVIFSDISVQDRNHWGRSRKHSEIKAVLIAMIRDLDENRRMVEKRQGRTAQAEGRASAKALR